MKYEHIIDVTTFNISGIFIAYTTCLCHQVLLHGQKRYVSVELTNVRSDFEVFKSTRLMYSKLCETKNSEKITQINLCSTLRNKIVINFVLNV